MDARDILAVMQSAEREAAELMLHARGMLAECKSGHRDVVTEYDRRVQTLLIDRLSAACPGARFFCEENDRHDELSAARLFIIDPIDGTMNFVRRMNHSCISAACWRGGVPEAAAIYNPYVDEMFTALRGGGAYLNGRPLHVDEAPLAETLVCCGTAPYNEELIGETFRVMELACRLSLDIRRQGSAELDLCSVAAGRAGAYCELSLSLWDYAAGALLVEEAGGRCSRLDGSPLPYDGGKTSILAGGKRAWAELCEALKRC